MASVLRASISIPSNSNVKRLGSDRASDVPMLGSTVRVGSEKDETLNQNMSSNQTTTEPNQRKRQATEHIHLSEDDADESFPRFLVVQAISGSPISYLICTIQKLLQCAVGTVKSAKKIRSGAVLTEVDSQRVAKRVLDMTNWLDTEIKVSPHRSLNCCRGVIRCRDFKDCADDEVLDA